MLRAIVGPLLPPEPPKPRGGRPRVPDRAWLTGILSVLQRGIPWANADQDLVLDRNRRTFRVELQDGAIRLTVNGLLMLESEVSPDAAGQFGVRSDDVEVNVRSLRVLAR